MKPYSLYIHVPYCKKKCRYCNFLSSAAESKDTKLYTDALLAELKMYKPFLSQRRLKSIYIGGGTPSMLEPESLDRLLRAVRLLFVNAKNTEITIEVNPESASLEKLKIMYELGVNRISVGLQSFDNNILGFLGRLHNADSSFAAVENARSAGFKNINVDVIYGVPSQNITIELEGIKKIMPEHVSFYYLTVEQGTPLFADKMFEPLNDDMFEWLYTLVHNEMTGAGYEHYEVSNFAKKGCQSIHNMNYWERGDYLGIGAGAHGFFRAGLPWIDVTGEVRYKNAYPPSVYIRKMLDKSSVGKFPISGTELLDRDAAIFEHIFLSLRTWKDIDVDLVKNKTLLRHLSDNGLIDFHGDKLALTVAGMCVMDGIVTELF